jgi:predicted acetyltransferase
VSPARTPRVPPLRYRTARRTDVETLAELGLRAYRVSSLEQRREFYTDHPRFGLRDVRVGEIDGQVVCSMVLYPFTTFVRGHAVPLTGVGSVAVSPEHRRRGIGEALLRAMLREARQQGQALSVLYPFRGSFYRKLGYGTIEGTHSLAFAPSNLRPSEEARRVRRLMLPDRPVVEALFDRVAQQGHFALARRHEWWTRRLWTHYPGDWVVYEGRRRGLIEGYLYYEVDTTNGPFKLAVTLSEFVATTPEAQQGLIGYLAALRDQVVEIHFGAPADGRWPFLLESPQNLRPGPEIGLFADTGNLGMGAMLRLVDVKLALESIPVSPHAKGEVVLEVDDAVLPQNARAYRVAARDGRLKVRPEAVRPGARVRPPRLTVTSDMLGPLVAGTISPACAAEAALIGSTGGGAETIERWFQTRPAFLYRLNGF